MIYDASTGIIILDSKKEHFSFFISWQHSPEDVSRFIGWRKYFYFPMESVVKNGRDFYIIPIYLLKRVSQSWFNLARLARRHKLFRSFPPAGECTSWFWPKYLLK